ncbi:19511_t:CDS:2, partial [Cetraspora pellucida]
KKLDMLEGNDNSEQNSEEYSSQKEYNEEEYSEKEYSDQEEYEGIDDEERTCIRLLTFGASGMLTNAAKGTSKITNFFGPSTSALPMYSALWTASPRHLILAKLNYDEDESENSDADGGDDNSEEAYFELGDAVYEYFVRVYNGHEKVKASEVAANIVYVIPNPYKCKRIYFLGNFYLCNESFPISHHGQHQKYKWLVDDKDFRQYVNPVILPEHMGGIKKSISLRMAKKWLNILGCQFKKYQKEWWMATYEEIKMEQIPPVLRVDERELILVTYDECIFYSYDEKRGIWVYSGIMPLRKKGSEKSIITIKHLLKQIKKKAIPIFEAKFPGATAVFAFNNSTNHAAFADDALVVQKMNKGPREKQSVMRPTTFIDVNGRQRAQEMVFEEDYPNPNLREKPKGIKKILEERGLFKEELNLDCLMCKKKNDSERMDCCLRKIMASQPDFVIQKSTIVELIEGADHICIFYLKFYCELNFIEMYWGAAKRYARNHCDYTWTGLQEAVPEALNSVDIVTIRKFTRKSWRYMELYHGELIGKLAEYACKKFKLHRRVPENELASFVQENRERAIN